MAQPQLQKWTRCSTAVFPKMFTFREMSQVYPVPKNYNATPPPQRTAAPPHVVTVYNKLTAPALRMFHLQSVVFSGISHHPQLRFIGQAHAGHETHQTLVHQVLCNQH
jgi:hypothetical protein